MPLEWGVGNVLEVKGAEAYSYQLLTPGIFPCHPT